jgi:hypothetical protein
MLEVIPANDEARVHLVADEEKDRFSRREADATAPLCKELLEVDRLAESKLAAEHANRALLTREIKDEDDGHLLAE